MNAQALRLLKTTYSRVMQVSILNMQAPLNWIDEYVSKKVIGYGTAADEKINSIKDYRKLILDARKQAINLPYKATITTPYSPIFSGEVLAIFKDEMVIVIGRGKQAHRITLWMTSTFTFKQNKWQLISFHGSAPDTNTSSEDTFHIKEAEKKMQILQMEVAKRTEELSEKNYELKIEAALERVRAVAMAMQKQEDMLQICEIITDQLLQLGVKDIRNVQTAIFYESSSTYMNYEYYAKHDKTFITEVNYKNHRVQSNFASKMMKGPKEEVLEQFKGKKLQDWYNYQKSTNQFADKYLLKAHSLNYYWYSLGPVALGISTYYPLANAETDLFKRFLKVFELAYRRYLDIEKATVQAKEAQIEAALERIRARALAMQNSEEFTEVAKVLREQMGLLGQPELETAALHLYNEDVDNILSWRAFRLSSKLKGNINFGFIKIPKNACVISKEFVQKFKSKAADYTIEVNGAKQLDWYKILFKLAPEVQDAMIKSGTTKEKRYYHFSKFTGGALLMVTSKQPASDVIELQKRSAQVFDLAYRRFKDLQNAEAQAREAQIEVALERIRAASLAMKDSAAIGGIIYKLYGELTKLDAKLDRCFIMIVNPENKGITWWMAGQEGLLTENGFFIPMNQHASHLWYLDCWKKRRKKWQYLLEGKEKQDWEWFGFSKTDLVKLPEFIKKFMTGVNKINLSGSSDQFGSLVTGSFEPLPNEQQVIISRFTVAFNQAYIRFLDLQKAEAQAKEAQIETALERVRSRSMAMHTSLELKDVALELRKQMGLLGQKDLEVCAIHLYDDKGSFESWSAMRAPDKEGKILQTQARFPNKGIQIVDELMKHNKRGSKDYVLLNDAEKSVEWLIVLKKYAPDLHESIIHSIGNLPLKKIKSYWAVSDFLGGALVMVTYGEPDIQSRNLLRRSANVFEQAYIRFLDLKKVEAQVREAEIELALERVRSKTMAMHNSTDVGESVATLFKELMALGVLNKHNRCGIGIMHPNEVMEAWTASKYDEGKTELTIGQLDMTMHPLLQGVYKGWQLKNEIFQYQLKGADKQRYFNTISNQLNYKLNSDTFSLTSIIVNTSFYFNEGCLYIFSDEVFSIEKSNVFARFASVFGQTYRRYLDLQTAEANALEALRSASLDRVRAEIASMRTTADLEKITPLIWKELTILKIPFVRCGVFIMDELQQMIHTFLSTPDGKAIASLHLPYHSSPLVDSIEYWRAKKLYQVHWKLDTYAAFADAISNQGNSINKKKYLSSVPKEGIHLHLIPFLQGMLYVGNTALLTEGELSLIQSVADAFSTAYARYEDFIKLEDAKKQIENTLSDLQAAQKQLIQSEKMASLGELTAGIAHEIQNPLNFVNNFSEVSAELVDEMNAEIDKGNFIDAKEIATDLKQNLEKINHHGKRAGDIVKGMLQHSRTSSGIKEQTDINILADEYLRLAYHGLRAKDKSFNASMKTAFDANISKINIIPQDIGRVILNLITNAFYVVNEKSKLGIVGYGPTVEVSTKQLKDKIEIKVKDNGNGIPEAVKEKIFQPFFTTKPTGLGTGLGLSLSYDIVKAHGGELKVETKVGEGTQFIILLPLV